LIEIQRQNVRVLFVWRKKWDFYLRYYKTKKFLFFYFKNALFAYFLTFSFFFFFIYIFYKMIKKFNLICFQLGEDLEIGKFKYSIQGGVLGVKTPTFLGNFFNLLGIYKKKKIPKPPLNFPFHTKMFQNPSLEKFLDMPLKFNLTPILSPGI